MVASVSSDGQLPTWVEKPGSVFEEFYVSRSNATNPGLIDGKSGHLRR
jgi:hypothetical protein